MIKNVLLLSITAIAASRFPGANFVPPASVLDHSSGWFISTSLIYDSHFWIAFQIIWENKM